MPNDYVDSQKAIVQKLVNAYVATLKWIQAHKGAQIAASCPSSDYAGVGRVAYSAA